MAAIIGEPSVPSLARGRTFCFGLAQAALAFATWVAIASISAGDRQS